MKKVIVTGVTGGIGKGIAGYLAKKSYELILTSRNVEAMKALQGSFGSENLVAYQPVDFASFDSISQYAKGMSDKVDGIVLITPRPSFSDCLFPEGEQWLELVREAFVGPLEFLKQMIPHLNEGGKIVVISGLASIQYMDGHSCYGVLRAMWLAQAKAMAYELGPKKIYVNSISPGGVLSEKGVAKIQKKADERNVSFGEQYTQSIHNVPLRKYAQPEEIGSVVEFFLSDQSSHVTGVNLVCDGGFTRSY